MYAQIVLTKIRHLQYDKKKMVDILNISNSVTTFVLLNEYKSFFFAYFRTLKCDI